MHTLQEYLIGHLERIENRCVLIGHGEQPVIGDDDLRVDVLFQALNALLGLHRSPATFEPERSCHDADGERTHVTSDLGNHWRSAGSGATALACRNEDHVRALKRSLDLFAMVLSSLTADLGVRSCAEPTGELAADV